MLIHNLNHEQSLLTRLDALVAESDELRVLVGYFYFYGVSALHAGLASNPGFKLKILVGLEAEDHAGKIVEFAGAEGPQVTDEDRQRDFLKGLRSVMRGKEIDSRQYYERVSLFIDLVKSGQVELRERRRERIMIVFRRVHRSRLPIRCA